MGESAWVDGMIALFQLSSRYEMLMISSRNHSSTLICSTICILAPSPSAPTGTMPTSTASVASRLLRLIPPSTPAPRLVVIIRNASSTLTTRLACARLSARFDSVLSMLILRGKSGFLPDGMWIGLTSGRGNVNVRVRTG